jgi:hypothetical protein
MRAGAAAWRSSTSARLQPNSNRQAALAAKTNVRDMAAPMRIALVP